MALRRSASRRENKIKKALLLLVVSGLCGSASPGAFANLAVTPPLSAVYATVPDITTCQEGQLTTGIKQEVLNEINYARGLNGLSPLQYNPQYDEDTQQAALIQDANNELNQSPATNSNCYTTGGAYASAHSNLADGPELAPELTIPIYIGDVFNMASSANPGHRRWLLNPDPGNVLSFGMVGDASDLMVFDNTYGQSFDATYLDTDFVAYPYHQYPVDYFNTAVQYLPATDTRAGVQIGPPSPRQENTLLTDTSSYPRLSFTAIIDKSSLINNASVDYSKATVSMADSNGNPVSVTGIYSDNQDFGVPNILTWQCGELTLGDTYNVTLNGVSTPSGVKNYQYWFQIMDNPLGDVNRDFRIDIADVILVLRALTGQVTLTWKQRILADMNQDGTVDINDVIELLQTIVH